MTLRKFGRGEIIPEKDDAAVSKEASDKEWTTEDEAELAEENADG